MLTNCKMQNPNLFYTPFTPSSVSKKSWVQAMVQVLVHAFVGLLRLHMILLHKYFMLQTRATTQSARSITVEMSKHMLVFWESQVQLHRGLSFEHLLVCVNHLAWHYTQVEHYTSVSSAIM